MQIILYTVGLGLLAVLLGGLFLLLGGPAQDVLNWTGALVLCALALGIGALALRGTR